jgi:hypothetical protein
MLGDSPREGAIFPVSATVSFSPHPDRERDDNFGSGLIDPIQALQLADPRTATTTPPAPARPIRQR